MKRKLPPKISAALEHLDQGVEMLREARTKKTSKLKFTLDGRLIGDIGELLAVEHLGITLKEGQPAGFDGSDSNECQVEIKTTRLDSFAFRKIAERVICIKIHGASHWEVIFDGHGSLIAKAFKKQDFSEGMHAVRRDHPASLKSQRQLSMARVRVLNPH